MPAAKGDDWGPFQAFHGKTNQVDRALGCRFRQPGGSGRGAELARPPHIDCRSAAVQSQSNEREIPLRASPLRAGGNCDVLPRWAELPESSPDFAVLQG